MTAVASLKVTVHRHKNGRWSVYMTLPDGSTQSVRSILDVRNVDGYIWQALTKMEGRAE